ncbi:Bug family tripartite tricarboxylate transporter substrate binding protein [Streptomyces sasae]|uniref:Bug family tripartite tricarboxylate transporter substrate binding protein n=1 Tax=Streptomyces sasae TaxID=1266772 RepID=UPI00293174FB|nr:tripartite tricarboxylate transporter substrate binding protein [Streptomyces sasae]
MRGRSHVLRGALLALSLFLVTGCQVLPDGEGADTGLRIMVPNTPGGGYDTTARTVARVLQETGVDSGVQVFNLPGAGGTVGLQRIVNERGNGRLVLQMGLGVIGASHVAHAKASVIETTPLARLVEEAGAVVVRRDSPYRSIDDVIAAWKRNPASLKVGGGSSPGGPDHLLAMELAKAVGIKPHRVGYVAYGGGGGDLLPALLDGKVDFATTGFGEFLDQIDASQLRVLAVTSPRPIDALPGVPTLKASGIDLVFSNWRGVVAPPGIKGADRKRWIEALTAMHRSRQWKAELRRHGWTDAFTTGDAFAAYLSEQDTSVARLVRDLGLD